VLGIFILGVTEKGIDGEPLKDFLRLAQGANDHLYSDHRLNLRLVDDILDLGHGAHDFVHTDKVGLASEFVPVCVPKT
jgi:hypothetical protein